jgi:hypothetical protein
MMTRKNVKKVRDAWARRDKLYAEGAKLYAEGNEMADTKQTEATCWEHCGHQHDELEFSTPRMW